MTTRPTRRGHTRQMFNGGMSMAADTTGTNDFELVRQLEALASLTENLASLGGLLDTHEQREEGVDFFELLNLWWQEDIHSRLLTWLLDPNGSHGVGDYFLTNFLLHSAGKAADLGTPTISEDRISDGDWSGATSQREWYTVVDGGSGWLDILVVNKRLKTLCAIENKIFSPESGRQLTFYCEALERDYFNYTRHYVFLSPTGMVPQQPEDQLTWTPVSYDAVLELAERTIAEHEDHLHTDVHTLLRQYTNTLRRRIVPVPSDVQKRAREIYIANRHAVELAYQHKPDYAAETKQMLMEAVRQQGWEIDLNYSPYFRFRPTEWDSISALQTGAEFRQSNALLRFEFSVDTRSTRLQLTLFRGADESIRERIVASINEHPELFNRADVVHETGIMFLHVGDNILRESDFDNWDDQAVRDRIKASVEYFGANQFPAMNEVIVQCLRGYEGKEASA